MDKIIKWIKKNQKNSSLQNKKDYYWLGEFLYTKEKVIRISKNAKWTANRTYKYYDEVNFERLTPQQLTKIKIDNFDLVVKRRQLSREEALLENISTEVKISHN